MTQVAFNIVMQNGLKYHCIMGKTICLRVKGKVVKETALNSVVSFQRISLVVCHIMECWDKGLRWDFKVSILFSFSLINAQIGIWLWLLHRRQTRSGLGFWIKESECLAGLGKKKVSDKRSEQRERSLSLNSCSANPLWVQPEP